MKLLLQLLLDLRGVVVCQVSLHVEHAFDVAVPLRQANDLYAAFGNKSLRKQVRCACTYVTSIPVLSGDGWDHAGVLAARVM